MYHSHPVPVFNLYLICTGIRPPLIDIKLLQALIIRINKKGKYWLNDFNYLNNNMINIIKIF